MLLFRCCLDIDLACQLLSPAFISACSFAEQINWINWIKSFPLPWTIVNRFQARLSNLFLFVFRYTNKSTAVVDTVARKFSPLRLQWILANVPSRILCKADSRLDLRTPVSATSVTCSAQQRPSPPPASRTRRHRRPAKTHWPPPRLSIRAPPRCSAHRPSAPPLSSQRIVRVTARHCWIQMPIIPAKLALVLLVSNKQLHNQPPACHHRLHLWPDWTHRPVRQIIWRPHSHPPPWTPIRPHYLTNCSRTVTS